MNSITFGYAKVFDVLRLLDAAANMRANRNPYQQERDMTATYDPATDIVDRVAGLIPGSSAYVTRHRRDKVAVATQLSYEGLFDPSLTDLTLTERLLVALHACTLSNASALGAHYFAQLGAVGVNSELIDQVSQGAIDLISDPRLLAILTFTGTLIENPVGGDEAALKRLPAAGLTTPAVVALAQLIAFLSYQIRLQAGLRALKAINVSESA
jgi:uncharacterized protein YciW